MREVFGIVDAALSLRTVPAVGCRGQVSKGRPALEKGGAAFTAVIAGLGAQGYRAGGRGRMSHGRGRAIMGLTIRLGLIGDHIGASQAPRLHRSAAKPLPTPCAQPFPRFA